MDASGIRRRLSRFDALVLTALIWFLAKFVRYTFPPLFGTLEATYGVSTTLLGVAFSGLMLVYAAMQFPSGLLADHLGSAKVIAGGALLASAATLVLAVDVPFVLFAGAMLVVGAGTGAHKTVAVRLLSRTYPTRTGRTLGILDTVGAFGGVAAPAAVLLFTDVLAGATWRTLFFVTGVVGVALAVAFAVRVTANHPETVVGHSGNTADVDLRQYAELFRERRFAAVAALTLLFAFGYNGTVAFLPLYLTRVGGLSSATAGLIYSALFAASLVQLVTGEASDRVGTLPVLGITLALATAALIALVLLVGMAGPVAIGAAVVALGLGAHGYRPVRGAYLMAVVPDSLAGGGLGVVRTLLMGAGAVAPALVGYLSETAGFRPAFWLLAGTMAAATLLVAVLWIDERASSA